MKAPPRTKLSKAFLYFKLVSIQASRQIPIRILEILGQLFPESSWGCKIRGFFYRPFLKKCGKNFQVGLMVKLEHAGGIEVGNDVYIGHGTWLSGLRGGICLEDEVLIGPFVRMVSSNHTFVNGSARFGPGVGGHIRIGKGTWIAGGVSVMAGVEVGPGCLLASGAVVTKGVEAGLCVGGIPAQPIGTAKEKQAPSETSTAS